MQITIPANAEDWLRQQAQQAGFANVQDYVLAVVLPSQTSTAANGSRSFYHTAEESGLSGGGAEYPTGLSTPPTHMAGLCA